MCSAWVPCLPWLLCPFARTILIQKQLASRFHLACLSCFPSCSCSPQHRPKLSRPRILDANTTTNSFNQWERTRFTGTRKRKRRRRLHLDGLSPLSIHLSRRRRHHLHHHRPTDLPGIESSIIFFSPSPCIATGYCRVHSSFFFFPLAVVEVAAAAPTSAAHCHHCSSTASPHKLVFGCWNIARTIFVCVVASRTFACSSISQGESFREIQMHTWRRTARRMDHTNQCT